MKKSRFAIHEAGRESTMEGVLFLSLSLFGRRQDLSRPHGKGRAGAAKASNSLGANFIGLINVLLEKASSRFSRSPLS
jgi:hypothetical protein